MTRENASFLSKPARPGLVEGCGHSQRFVQAHTSLNSLLRAPGSAETAPRHRPGAGERVLLFPVRQEGGHAPDRSLRGSGWAIHYTNAISRGHYKHRQEESQRDS